MPGDVDKAEPGKNHLPSHDRRHRALGELLGGGAQVLFILRVAALSF